MNLRFGGISISNSALYAQQMGNEVAYFCDDEVLGWYISPLPVMRAPVIKHVV